MLFQRSYFALSLHKQFSEDELLHVFGVRHYDDVPHYDVITHHWSNLQDTLHYSFDALNDTYNINLKPVTYFTHDTIYVTRNGNQSSLKIGKDIEVDNCHYHGNVESHENALAAFSLCSELRGMIMMPDHFVIVHPVPKKHRKNNDRSHVVFRRSSGLSDAEMSGLLSGFDLRGSSQRDTEESESFCLVEADSNYTVVAPKHVDRLSPDISYQRDPGAQKHLELALFLDERLWKHFRKEYGNQRAESELVDFSLALINNVYVLYQHTSITPNIDITVVRYELWQNQPADFPNAKHRFGHAQLFLDGFCSYQARLNTKEDNDVRHWDHATLLTGIDIYHTTSSVAGVAPVARMCDHDFSCSLVEGLHLGRSFVLAHEMGHNLGMVHDGVQNTCSSRCCLMSAVNGAGKTTWSACSVREFQAYMATLGQRAHLPDCLSDIPFHELHGRDFNHKTDLRLPGQRLTANQQCAYFWGRGYANEVPSGKAIENICEIIWCGDGGTSISTSHPALEGTWCGNNNWCRGGFCVPWIPSERPPVVDGGWSTWMGVNNRVCSNCKVHGSVRLRRDERFCDNPAPNNNGILCEGSAKRGIICGGISDCKSGFDEKMSFSDKICLSFMNDPRSPDTELTGHSFHHPDSPCKIWCHLTQSDLIRNKDNYPDGSPCGSNRYCVDGECLNLSCQQKAVVFNQQQDCPSSKTARIAPARPRTWTAWSLWSQCSSSCGEGSKKRTRNCPGLGPTPCTGASEELKICEESLCPVIIQPSWNSWGQWAECSQTCGSGHRTRSRACSISDRCPGDTWESQRCFLNDCNEWQDWGAWSSCSVSCTLVSGVGGIRWRVRICPGTACPGDRSESQQCNGNLACSAKWSLWAGWSQCTHSCGEGTSQRSRDCLTEGGAKLSLSRCRSGSENELERKRCNLRPCSTWDQWSIWSLCSASCGNFGFQSRRRSCEATRGGRCSGQRHQQRACNHQECPAGWSDWANWSVCSRTCGGGLRRRTRQCTPKDSSQCIGNTVDVTECHKEPCPVWSSWSRWDSCSVSCGSGEQTRSRTCRTSEAADIFLSHFVRVGARVDQSELDGEKNQWNYPARCTGDAIGRQTCNKSPCSGDWSSWESWGQCSASCNGGRKLRRRFCLSITSCTGFSLEFNFCNKQQCQKDEDGWTLWEIWGSCSRSCEGGGIQTRRRNCRLLVCRGTSLQNRNCNDHIFCPTSQQLRRRDSDTSELRVPTWAEWSVWSGCSCYTLKQIRRRHCDIISPSIQGYCIGSVLQEQNCHEPSSCEQINGKWAHWTKWSQCNAQCGVQGEQIRHRICSDPFPVNHGAYCLGRATEQQFCASEEDLAILNQAQCLGSPVHGHWSNWSKFSTCSTTCGTGGFRSRTRYCNNPVPENRGRNCNGNDFEIVPCDRRSTCPNTSHGHWNSWTSWSPCTQSCGFAFQNRHRLCNKPAPHNGGRRCRGLAYNTRICTLPQCQDAVDGNWNSWGAWSRCSSNCGFGLQTRVRLCTDPQVQHGGLPCLGVSTDIQTCISPGTDCMPQLSHEESFEQSLRQWEQSNL